MKKLLFTTLTLGFCMFCFSIPKYDEGRVQVKGIQLLQDNADNNMYYYIPRFPRISTRSDGDFDFMFMKYIDKGSKGANGGLFHALIEFSLPPEEIQKLEDSLRLVVNNNKAHIVGSVPLQQVMKNGEDGLASFQVISSILSDPSKGNPFTQSLITSGHAPFLEGSKAAIAARLSQEGATLLWESLLGRTSDVSVMINGYYEAYVKAYQATISAEVSTIYEHYSRISNEQQGFTRDQARKITDELVQNQVIKIEAFDRTAALGIKADEMKALLNLVTDKLIELLFDAKTGWAKVPAGETAVDPEQIKGRQERGFFSQIFSGSNNQEYVTDNQFVLKKRTDIRTNSFYLNLAQSTTVKVPLYSSGNLSGIYDAMQAKASTVDKYFKIVNMDDVDFQKRDISFIMDGGFTESFTDIFNFVNVSFRKQYGAGQQETTSDLLFTRKNLEGSNSTLMQTVNYPRLGKGSDWLEYEYRISWNLKGNNKTLHFPADETAWIKTSDPGVTIMPPLQKEKITVEVDRFAFGDTGSLSTIEVRFIVMIAGAPTIQKKLLLRPSDASNIHEVTLFHDLNEPMAYQVLRPVAGNMEAGPLKELTSDFVPIGPAPAKN